MFKWLEQLLFDLFNWQRPRKPMPTSPIPVKPIAPPPVATKPQPVETVKPKSKLTTIKGVAESLQIYDSVTKKVAKKMTAQNIEEWILDNIKYQFHWSPQGSEMTWNEKQGDCTDRAMLAQRMLGYIDIDSTLQHGYANGEKHDWLKTDDYTMFTQGYDTIEFIAPGIW